MNHCFLLVPATGFTDGKRRDPFERLLVFNFTTDVTMFGLFALIYRHQHRSRHASGKDVNQHRFGSIIIDQEVLIDSWIRVRSVVPLNRSRKP